MSFKPKNSTSFFNARDQPVTALSNVDLTVGQGDFVSLIGPSGCGKTTLLRAIADLTPLTSGSLRVNGQTPDEARRARAYGYVFQAPALFPWRNVTRQRHAAAGTRAHAES